MRPTVSVIIVSDYLPNVDDELSHFFRCLQALSDQDFSESVEYITILRASLPTSTQTQFKKILPSLKIRVLPNASSPHLKKWGASQATGEIIAFTDADCVPDRSWISAIVDALREHPEISVISGKTVYEEPEILPRACFLIGRALMERRKKGLTNRLTNHNFAMRQNAFVQISFPECVTPFIGTVMAKMVLDSGHRILYEPLARTTHVYDGWSFECDIRRNNGYAFIMNRMSYPGLRYSYIARLSYLGMSIFYFGRLLQIWWVCLFRFSAYGLAWYELPFAIGLAPVALMYELSGMLSAIRKKPLCETAYY